MTIFGDIAYAQLDNTDQGQEQAAEYDGFRATIDKTVRFLSWAWIVPASLAGELMTNEIVYGEGFYFAETLNRFRQFTRNMALYALGFLFFWKIGETFVKGGDISGLGSLLLKTMGAGILIPLSWFLVAAVVDLSTVATVAVGGLPMEAMQELRDGLELDNKIPISKVVYVENYEIGTETTLPNNTRMLTYEDLLPQGDSVAGSLIFMGAGVMRLDQSLEIGDKNDTGETADQISSVFIRLIMIIMLVVPMIVLVVVNIVRVVYIWLWIVTIPFIILDYFYEGPLSSRDEFKLSNIISLIFQPVVVVGTLSVGILIILGMYGALLGNEQVADQGMAELINVSIQGDSSALIGDNTTSEVVIDGEIFDQAGDIAGGGVGRMVVSLFMIFLIWSLVKVGFSTSQLTKSISDGMYGFAEQMASTIPVVPIPGLGMQSVSSIERGKQQLERTNPFKKKIDKEAYNLSNKVNTTLGLQEETYTPDQSRELSKALLSPAMQGKNAYNWWKKLKEQQAQSDMPLNAEIKSMIVEWMKRNSEQSQKIFVGVDTTKSKDDLLKLFNNSETENNAGSFRKAINGILSNSDDPVSITLDKLIRITGESSTDTLLNKYAKI